MPDAWFPRRFRLNDALTLETLLHAAEVWQIYAANGGARVLVAQAAPAQQWVALGLLPQGALTEMTFGEEHYAWFYSPASAILAPAEASDTAEGPQDVVAFARALAALRRCAPMASPEHAVFSSLHGCLLPVRFDDEEGAADDELWLGEWLTGGARVSATETERVMQLRRGCTPEDIAAVLAAAGLAAPKVKTADSRPKTEVEAQADAPRPPRGEFSLPGRTALESFFREHVIDIIEHEADYAAMGIGFPSAFILHGPPGCGKTYAVEQLVQYLDWPAYYVEAATVGSPYIHETGKKIAALFDKAMEHAPSVLVLDEMESFLSSRESSANAGGHHTEEMAEFLRKIPEAVSKHVLVVGMTNMPEAIDPAIRRRGRFDHVIEVGMPSAEEIRQVLDKGFGQLPHEENLQTARAAELLAGHPMSDVAFLLRETARRTARAHAKMITQQTLDAVAASLGEPGEAPRTIGFHP